MTSHRWPATAMVTAATLLPSRTQLEAIHAIPCTTPVHRRRLHQPGQRRTLRPTPPTGPTAEGSLALQRRQVETDTRTVSQETANVLLHRQLSKPSDQTMPPTGNSGRPCRPAPQRRQRPPRQPASAMRTVPLNQDRPIRRRLWQPETWGVTPDRRRILAAMRWVASLTPRFSGLSSPGGAQGG